ncbi:UNVERIFIED_ORG: hypothetical protein QOE_3938 [Clostridioides difficile F501]
MGWVMGETVTLNPIFEGLKRAFCRTAPRNEEAGMKSCSCPLDLGIYYHTIA